MALGITMQQYRIDNPTQIDAQDIAARTAAGNRVIVQYSQAAYDQQQLAALNELARLHGRKLEIRFYGHYSDHFDASALRFIPDAQCVSIDCLMEATNLQALSLLKNLTELNLGVFELNDADVLAACNSPSLESLTLGDTRNCQINLEPLSRCVRLNRFHTTGHTKGISTICSLPSLQNLSLSSIKRKDELGFVSAIPSLTSLRLMAGGRTSIAHVTAPRLNTLEIIRVQGLENLGDLGRFQKLERLLLEDQIKLKGFRAGPNPNLRELTVNNCKTMTTIHGIAELENLLVLQISRTAINYESFVESGLPPRLTTFEFRTGSRRRDSEIRVDLSARGWTV